jgi:hypothetical protein
MLITMLHILIHATQMLTNATPHPTNTHSMLTYPRNTLSQYITAGPTTYPIQGSIDQYAEFFVNISIGTPPQILRVQVDTGMHLF